MALHYKPVHINITNSFYGVGVALSPYVMSFALANRTWHEGYRFVFFTRSAIALLAFLSLPLWSRSSGEGERGPVQTVSNRELLKNAKVRWVLLLFIVSCAVEVCTGTWSSSYLVLAKGLPAASAAGYVVFYYAGMASGRFLAGLLSRRIAPWDLIKAGIGAALAAILLLAFSSGTALSVVSLFFIGFGIGPIFPNMLYLTPVNFSKEISQSVTGLEMASSYMGILAAPALFGLVVRFLPIAVLPVYLLLIFLFAPVSVYFFMKRNKERREAPEKAD